MSNEPKVQERAAQHYAGIRTPVPMDGISGAVDDAFPELFGWLAGQGVALGGLPEGRYVVLRHAGPYDGLIGSNAALQQWAREQGVEFDTWDTAEGCAWRARAEHYLTDPSKEPDPAKWEVDVAYLTRKA